MKKLLLILFVLTISLVTASAQTVYVCTGSYAYAYHSTPQCRGLNNCHGQIYSISENDAIYRYNRKPCCLCWSNVGNNCATDGYVSPGYSGGGYNDSDAYAFLAAGILVVSTSAIILSNDMYCYGDVNIPSYTKDNSFDVTMDFGFRKTFKECALEYGAITKFKKEYSKYGNYYIYENDWGGQFSFVHNIFYRHMSEKTKFYLGATYVYFYDNSWGGIAGFSWEPVGRLKLDLRYEYTVNKDFEETRNQLKLGLIFKYQKRCFWNWNK